MNTLMQYGPIISLLIVLWVLPWKGYALWTAAKRGQRGWFVAILILNTFAILDIFYLFYIAKKQIKDIKHDIKGTAKKIEKEVDEAIK